LAGAKRKRAPLGPELSKKKKKKNPLGGAPAVNSGVPPKRIQRGQGLVFLRSDDPPPWRAQLEKNRKLPEAKYLFKNQRPPNPKKSQPVF